MSATIKFGADIEVNMASYMTSGPGRFALGSESDLVQAFFSINSDLSWMLPGVQYSKTDIVARLSLSGTSDRIEVKQSLLSDTASDYLQRAYIWNSGVYRVANDVTFSVNAQGQRSIQNYSVRPFNENFDFEGGGLIATVANAVLQPAIDPWKIGRKVSIAFVDDGIPKTTYTLANLSSEGLQYISHLASGAASAALLGPIGVASIIDDLWISGVTRTIYQGKVIYGSVDAETLSASTVETLPASSPLGGYADLTAGNGVVLVSGAGNDTSSGGMGNDVLFGGTGNDKLVGLEGADYIEGNVGDDTLDGGTGNDTLLGGTGDDTYQFTTGHGRDTLLDADGQGSIVLNGVALSSGKKLAESDTVWWDATETYRIARVSDTQLLITPKAGGDSITVKNWSPGDLGLSLGEEVDEQEEPQPPAVYFGDQRAPRLGIEARQEDIDGAHPSYGVYDWSLTTWRPDGSLQGGIVQADFADVISVAGQVAAVKMFGFGGNDALTGGHRADVMFAGAGNDAAQGVAWLYGVHGKEGVAAVPANQAVWRLSA